jgi:outer membrane immunogenic protein
MGSRGSHLSWIFRLGAAVSVAFALALPASAEDRGAIVSSAERSQWTGYYAGILGGYGWGEPTVDFSGNPAAESGYITSGAIYQRIAISPRGWQGGLAAGYNHQLGRFVVGVETDLAYANIRSSRTVSTGRAATSVETSSPPFVDSSGQPLRSIKSYSRYQSSAGQVLHALGSLRVRAGFLATDRLLIYGTGGLAYGRATLSASVSNTGTNDEWISSSGGAIFFTEQFPACHDICASTSMSRWLVGGAIGAGLEYALIDRWTARVEYLYYNLGKVSTTIVDPRFPTYAFNASALFAGQVVRFGLTYQFQ